MELSLRSEQVELVDFDEPAVAPLPELPDGWERTAGPWPRASRWVERVERVRVNAEAATDADLVAACERKDVETEWLSEPVERVYRGELPPGWIVREMGLGGFQVVKNVSDGEDLFANVENRSDLAFVCAIRERGAREAGRVSSYSTE